MDSKVLKGRAKELLSENLGVLLACGMLLFVLGMVEQVSQAINQSGNSRESKEFIGLFVSSLIITMIGLVIRFWFYRILLALLRGEKSIDIGTVIKNSVPPFFKLLGAWLLTNLVIGLGLILLIVPGVILTFSYSQVFKIIANDPNISVTDAMRESRLMMNGHKWEFFVLQVSFIGWFLLAIVTCGLSGIYVIPYTELTYTGYYLTICGENLEKQTDSTVE